VGRKLVSDLKASWYVTRAAGLLDSALQLTGDERFSPIIERIESELDALAEEMQKVGL
jgi:hypothetical protein